jgi:CheY-like chemotaxis protein
MRPPVVLVVDDVEDTREMYLEYLSFAGFRVAGAADGEAAIDAARKLQPAVIVMDLSLPRLDGWEATRILKSDPSTCDIPIIVLTGHAEPACRDEATLAGCDRFVTKPALPNEVAEIILGVLAKRDADRSSNF